MTSEVVRRCPQTDLKRNEGISLIDLAQQMWNSKVEQTSSEPDRDEYVDHFEAIVQSYSLLNHRPSSTETKQIQDLVTLLGHLHLESSWVSYIPCHLGHSKAIDLAVQGVVQAYSYRAGNGLRYLSSAYEAYGKAVSALRETISLSDDSLMAIALLSFFESVLERHLEATCSHYKGIEKILLARKSSHATEFARAIMYSNWDRRFRAPVAMGIASPFEESSWLELDPPEQLNVLKDTWRLEKVTHQLFFRLPRLVAYTRSLRMANDSPIRFTTMRFTRRSQSSS